jgi:hypothetical protein
MSTTTTPKAADLPLLARELVEAAEALGRAEDRVRELVHTVAAVASEALLDRVGPLSAVLRAEAQTLVELVTDDLEHGHGAELVAEDAAAFEALVRLAW